MQTPIRYSWCDEIDEAANGEKALAAVAKQRPDLILMDIQLPKLNGYDATRQIRANAALDGVPIIAITSYALSLGSRSLGTRGTS